MNQAKAKIKSDLSQQAGKWRDEVLEQVKKKPGEKAAGVREQLGVSGGSSQGKQVQTFQTEAQRQLAQKEMEDKTQAEQQIAKVRQELEQEIDKYRKLREEQLQTRRQDQNKEVSEEEMKKQKRQETLAGSQSSRPKGPQGLVAGLRARGRKSKAELAGGRRSG